MKPLEFNSSGRTWGAPSHYLVGSELARFPLGSGVLSVAFATVLNPPPLVTFPAPSSSNAACGFPALRLPDSFTPKFMGAIMLEELSLSLGIGLCSH